MPEFVEVCEAAARLGGGVLLDWADRFQAREKAPADLVTEADLASQEAIHRYVLDQFPEHDFLGEEDPASRPRTSRWRWVVDPLDGTTNYVHQLHNYSVSVALQQDDEIIAGCVYDPATEECFTATVGGGAYLGGQRLQVSEIKQLSQALVAASFPAGVQIDDPSIDDFIRVMVACQAVRRMGSAALNLSYVASGRMDGYWAMATKIWDVAAGVLLVSEAGGLVTAPDGSPLDLAHPQFVCTSTPELHAELSGMLGQGRVR